MATSKTWSLNDIVSDARKLPPRIVFHAVEGLGKTSFAAFSDRPVFLMARGETGLDTLIDSGRLPQTPHFPEIISWPETLAALDFLERSEHEFRTLVLDALNGFERLMHEEVCRREFSGDWSEKGFLGYMRGYELSLADWRDFLCRLDRIREKGMKIICLCHTRVTPFKNPEGSDYDRYEPDLHRKTWSLTHKWADIVLFGNYYTAIDDKGVRAKGKGGTQRVIYTERTAAFDAKNRHGLPPDIYLPNGPAESAQAFRQAMMEAKNNGVAQTQ